MSNSLSFRLFSFTIPRSPNWAVLEAPKLPSFSSKLTKFSLFRTITDERIPVKPVFSAPSASQSATLQPIEELSPKLQEIARLFQVVEEPKAKYEQFLFYGRNLKPLDGQYKTSENKVQGCVSQGLSGRPVEEIVRVPSDFVVLLGLQQSLTPSRNNGFLNMLNLMQKKASQLYVEAEKAGNLGNELSSERKVEISKSRLEMKVEDGDVRNEVADKEAAVISKFDSGNGGALGSRGMRIRERLSNELKPIQLEVEDIDHQHADHVGVRGYDGETHFNVRVVSDEFEGKSLLKRHRMIYDLLQDELQSGLHALSIVAKTPSEVSSG